MEGARRAETGCRPSCGGVAHQSASLGAQALEGGCGYSLPGPRLPRGAAWALPGLGVAVRRTCGPPQGDEIAFVVFSGGMRSTTLAAPVIKNVLLSGALDGGLATVKLTVDVTDPDGLSDIAGGKLFSKDKSKFLGAFAQLSGGTFTTDLTWKTVNEVETILLTEGATTTRFVLIELTDAASNTASREQQVELSCAGCGATCIACGKCPSGGDPACAVNGCADSCGPTGCACDCG